METTPKKKWRWGVFRWLVILLIVLLVIATGYYAPIQPHVQLEPENVTGTLFKLPVIGEFSLRNTFVATLLVDVILIALAFSVYRATRKGEPVLRGVAGAIEAIIEAIYNMAETTAGKWVRAIFPIMATIILMVLVANWMELIPGVDSFGILHHPGEGQHGYPTKVLFDFGKTSIETLVKGTPTDAGHTSGEESFILVPFLRVASTDLSFTAALALIAVFMTQVIGLRAQGVRYFVKFVNLRNFLKMWFRERLGPFDLINPFIDVFVGVLETIAEIAKIISFSFRLFGNVFAGSVLLFVIGTLLPMIQSPFLILEVLVGLIQALVFGMLTMVFMTMAVQSHGNHEEKHPAAQSAG